MVLTQLTAELVARGQSVLDGQFAAATAHCCSPLVVFLEQRRIVFPQPLILQQGLALLRQELRKRHIIRLQPDISATELPRAGRFRVWVRWQEISADGAGDRSSDVIYYCHQDAGTIRTEMLHYTRLSMPEMRNSFAALAKSA